MQLVVMIRDSFLLAVWGRAFFKFYINIYKYYDHPRLPDLYIWRLYILRPPSTVGFIYMESIYIATFRPPKAAENFLIPHFWPDFGLLLYIWNPYIYKPTTKFFCYIYGIHIYI